MVGGIQSPGSESHFLGDKSYIALPLGASFFLFLFLFFIYFIIIY